MEKYTDKQEGEPKSFVRVGSEHNLKALLDLLHKEGIEIVSVISSDPRPEALELVSGDHIPSLNSKLEVKATYSKIRSVLENSEFRDDIISLIGSV